MKISDLLDRGKGRGVTGQQLATLTGMSIRAVREQVHRERLDGEPICSNPTGGYFLPETVDELRNCVRSLRSRGWEVLKVADSLKEYERRLPDAPHGCCPYGAE